MVVSSLRLMAQDDTDKLVRLTIAQLSLNGLQCNEMNSPGVYCKSPVKLPDNR